MALTRIQTLEVNLHDARLKYEDELRRHADTKDRLEELEAALRKCDEERLRAVAISTKAGALVAKLHNDRKTLIAALGVACTGTDKDVWPIVGMSK